MLRVLRIIGIVVFAALVAFSGHRLQELYLDGTLFEEYNSSRKAYVTLLGFSALALGVLGFIELTRDRIRISQLRSYRANHLQEPKKPVAASSSIYSAPETVDSWQGSRKRTSQSRQKQRFDATLFWLGLLRICTSVLLLTYAGLLVLKAALGIPDIGSDGFLYGILCFMALLSGITTAGVLLKKMWGLTCGYLLAICNLLIFPFGTAAGLILLIGLVGSAASFVLPSRERRREARKKAASKRVMV